MPMPSPTRDPGGFPPDVVARLMDYVERSADLIGVLDDRGNVVYMNHAARARLGVPADDTRTLTTADLFADSAFDLYYEQIRPRVIRGEVWSGYVPIRSREGEPLEMWATVVGEAWPGGEVRSLVVSARDVTEWRHIRDELGRQSTHDDLTGLVSRALLMDHIDSALGRARRTGAIVALVCIDLDNLNAVNDSFGHQAGDAVLVEVARRLRDAVRAIDTVARVGGDEFVVLFDGVDDEDEVENLSTRVHARLESEGIAVDDSLVNISASAGTVVARPDESGTHLLGRADAAMYEVKDERRWVPTATGPQPPPPDRGVSAHDVAVAVTQGSIVPYYRPVALTATGATVGYQVVARWHQRSGEVAPAADFVWAVERTAVGFSLDLTILRQLASGVTDHSGEATAYAHVSPGFLVRPGVARFVHEVLVRADLEPRRLALLIPERLITTRGRLLREGLAEVGELGVRFVIDLAAGGLPAEPVMTDELFSELRLGLGWADALAGRPDDVAAAIAFAHDRGLEAHVMGVETREQLDQLVDMKCDRVQGDLIGSPSPSPDGEPAGLGSS
jgi:diguanylate cyclase (GGDEF)-like protein/PAS domain S-box-containing protein